MSFTLESLTPAIGAIVHGLDLSAPHASLPLAELETTLLERKVLFFRDQTLDERAQRDIAAHFGPLHIHPIYPQSPVAPEIMLLDTALNDLRDNALWHSDVSFAEIPPLGAFLVARKIPPLGGDTLWTNAVAALAALPPALRSFLGTLHAWHDLAKSFPAERFGADPKSAAKLEAAKRNNPPVRHPVVRTHPTTGEQCIYVNEGFTTHIEGLDADASDSLLNLLFRHVTRPDFTVRWRWREGDVALWDNRVTQHYAVYDYGDAHRVMTRATIVGDRVR